MTRKFLYSVTICDKDAPKGEYHVGLWAHDSAKAFERGMQCGRVVRVERMPCRMFQSEPTKLMHSQKQPRLEMVAELGG